MNKVCVLGAGSWGSALAMVLASNNNDVFIWTRRQEQADEINNEHTNESYLPKIKLSGKIKATCDIKKAVVDSELIVLALPSQKIRFLCKEIKDIVNEKQILINVAKGIEYDTGKRISQICEEELPNNPYCMLSGPSHAEEVSVNMPTALVSASKDIVISRIVQDYFMNEYLRVYTNTDLIGVELGGATKNIIAFGAGILDGMGYGDNSKAALITRGINEICRFGKEMGADVSTFLGLTGVGDLVVTCTSMHSRNRRAGILIGKGKSLEETKKEIKMVVEGITATEAVYNMAQDLNIDMPITNAIYKTIHMGLDPNESIKELMGRAKKHENENKLVL
ncbi:NAD(P)H-dependent glycerol-3-phosphate dehydrogenase [Peptostreptococcus equinus]|uniref:Glycerol-3-phosphate dehydrogenase [NAD(P)+] n=1 Tax=Peptostreptococcus equinus TaxID=3003601 RepID=A0ABY7JQI3_9FIRM|nr:NAD(P)H-dependent glycerol-3-phosphate dehydrogenase [Peptostreptococcus sp. CBA3647]WAW15609.1 NAD(P)H-dependent glycerol-3-phosphate dehydrogenase [Peptostreptococcus sp. CBA3647]